jgi:protease IV
MPMSRRRKIFLIITGITLALALVCIVGLALFIGALRNSSPNIPDNSVLVLRLGGNLPDFVPEDPVASRLFGREDDSLTTLLWQLRKAKTDARIGAVVLEINFVNIGWGKADEIRDAIRDFRSSGKPIYAFMEFGSNKEYYIATACERIYVPPVGDLFINGLAADVTFFRGSLDKLGIYPDFFQIGRYKNAPDQYTRREMSESHREVVNALLDDQFARLVNTIAEARGRSPEDVRQIIDNAPLRSPQAREIGLIDGSLYRDQVSEELQRRLNYREGERLRTVSDSRYRQVTPESLGLNTGERIAIIYASGAIGSGESGEGPFGGQTVGSDTVVRAINTAARDSSIRAIVLRVDSPGGSVYASDAIWHAVVAAREAGKPVVVSMSDYAASGGYYISTHANRIVAHPSTITGSIGVFAGKPVMREFYNWIGVNNEYVLRGRNAGLFRETEQFTPEERRVFEGMIRGFYYDAFLPRVAQGRNRDVEYIDSIAQGRVWTGAQARERGLVDDFGGMERAIEVAKELAGIPAEAQVRRVVFPAPRTLLESLLGSQPEGTDTRTREQQRALAEVLPENMRRAFQHAAFFERMGRGEMMAMLPFDLQIR